VLTNDTYQRSVQFAQVKVVAGGARHGSLERLRARPAASASRRRTRCAMPHARRRSQGDHTKWSVVYDIRDRAPFSLARWVRWIDRRRRVRVPPPGGDVRHQCERSGDITHLLTPYDPEANRKLVYGSFAKTPFLSDVPAEAKDELARYPESTTCAREPAEQTGK
jgi:hypothetical protein